MTWPASRRPRSPSSRSLAWPLTRPRQPQTSTGLIGLFRLNSLFYIVIYTAIVVSSMRSTGTRKDSGIVSLALLGSGAVILLKVKTSATALFWMPYFPMFALGYYSHRLLPDANPDKERNLTPAFLAVAIVLILLDSQPIPRVLAASLGALILAAEANHKMRLESTNNYAKALGFLGAISYSL